MKVVYKKNKTVNLKETAKANKIKYITFYKRVNRDKLSFDEATSIPVTKYKTKIIKEVLKNCYMLSGGDKNEWIPPNDIKKLAKDKYNINL